VCCLLWKANRVQFEDGELLELNEIVEDSRTDVEEFYDNLLNSASCEDFEFQVKPNAQQKLCILKYLFNSAVVYSNNFKMSSTETAPGRGFRQFEDSLPNSRFKLATQGDDFAEIVGKTPRRKKKPKRKTTEET
jgi:hypothetical protein